MLYTEKDTVINAGNGTICEIAPQPNDRNLIPYDDNYDAEPVPGTENVFRRNARMDQYREKIRKHKAWLELIQHEYPMPYRHYRIGVYIRYFNQTKYENYLDYHKQQFIDTIALCPNWQLVNFYVEM